MEKIWVVAADSVRARFFQAEKPAGPLREMRDIINPEARLQERELVSDAKGSTYSGRGGVNGNGNRRQKYEPPSEKEHQEEMFAREVVQEVEKLRASGELDRLYVVAEPRFLGRLREQYSGPLQKCVRDEVTRSVTAESPQRIRELLPFRI